MSPKQPREKKQKPLTALERKVKKKKQEIIHKAKVKSQYYKDLATEYSQDTPDYVKEIFERTIDEDGNVVEYGEGTFTAPVKTEDRRRKQTSDDEQDHTKTHKPNPFKAQLDEHTKKVQTSQEEKGKRHANVAKQIKERKQYYQHRNKERGKMLAKHKNGQPNLATQMHILLDRLEKQK
ncbi:hypothetical protein DM01DRAFT_1411666 [Hesseltinella vesiculosa]|uniref:rRNA-processing protein FYV7 n=1 Tax=Hesseltinella vesiculosa TaxID=101127 RepID=A0A1X2G2Y5_9FUNG|nr:hypothetical protein DM01DRAFT_1411666 [Hesseltinella vesiculosa]